MAFDFKKEYKEFYMPKNKRNSNIGIGKSISYARKNSTNTEYFGKKAKNCEYVQLAVK